MFKLFFATPDKKIVADADLEEITLPAYVGELNILPGHAPLMTTLDAGILKYKLTSGVTGQMAISWGYCQISSDGVTVLAETAMAANEIDVKAVERRLAESEAALSTATLDEAQWKRAQNEISRLRAELSLAQKTP